MKSFKLYYEEFVEDKPKFKVGDLVIVAHPQGMTTRYKNEIRTIISIEKKDKYETQYKYDLDKIWNYFIYEN